jgi:hypothetical protein
MEGQTLQAGLDHVERVDGERGDGAGGQAGDGLDQRGREARMVFVHKGGGVVEVLMAWCLRTESRNDDVEAGKIKYFGRLCRGCDYTRTGYCSTTTIYRNI